MPNSPLSDRDTRRMKRGLKKELKEKEAKRHEDDDESEEELKHSGTVYVAYVPHFPIKSSCISILRRLLAIMIGNTSHRFGT